MMMPGEEITFNFSNEKHQKLQVRLINIREETDFLKRQEAGYVAPVRE